MLITLATEDRLYTLPLPEHVAGRFCIYDEVDAAAERNPILVFEANDDKWVCKATSRARPYGADGKPADQIVAEQSRVYNVDLRNSAKAAFLFAEESSGGQVEYEKYVVAQGARITIGRASGNTITYSRSIVSSHHATLSYQQNGWRLEDLNSTNGVYINNERMATISCDLNPGDSVWIAGMKILIGSNFIACNNPDRTAKFDASVLRSFVVDAAVRKKPTGWEAYDAEEDDGDDEDLFYRSPRFRRTADTFELEVDAAPAIQKPDDTPIMYMVGPSMTMGLAMVFSAAISMYTVMTSDGNFLTALPMAVMAVTMLIGMVLWPILARRSEDKKALKQEERRQARYREYLDSIRNQIHAEIEDQSAIAKENNPSVVTCLNRAFDRDRLLWERTVDHDDFASVRVGVGDVDLDADIDFPQAHFSIETDTLQDALKILEDEPKTLPSVPIAFDVKKEKMVGVIGARQKVVPFTRGIVAQLATLQGYDALKLGIAFDRAEDAQWHFMRYLPHSWNDDMSQRYYANNFQDIREVLLFLETLAAERLDVIENQGERVLDDAPFEPCYVVVIGDRSILAGSGLIEQLSSTKEDLGIHLILLFDELKDLPHDCATVVELLDDGAKIYDQHDMSGQAIEFNPDIAVSIENAEHLALTLANIKLEIDAGSQGLPKAVSFLDMYNVGKVEYLNAASRWTESNPAVSLAAPVGVGTDGDLFYLDLHEKIHGPHGLVAGMTGSGKSEFVITYLLSMAINYHPDEVAFILIDYKGGGLAGAFDNDRVHLPHLAGTITNLDGAAIDRALMSIQSELRRRQRIFNHARDISNEGTMDIYKYQQLRRQGVVEEAVPHLFIVSDEFAELKQQQPDFMEQLISTARIGRSLGVHLILATQKPAGVVNDQIRSNSKFKVCLKVQDREDSMDMLNRPDAASLVETGRFYLQVGFNEYFALGQSAYSGSKYIPSEKAGANKDESVVVISDTGREVLSAKPAMATNVKRTRQIVAIIEYLSSLADAEGARAHALWLPPIPENVYVGDLVKKYSWRSNPEAFEAVVGELDDPFNQDQRILSLSLDRDGHLIVCGASGSGKSLLVSGLLYSLLTRYRSDKLHVYIADYGGGTLSAFGEAPQVGDVISGESAEKTVNLLKMLTRQLSERKRLFAKMGLEASAANCGLPRILVVIENIAAFYEGFEDYEETLNKLVREGARYGIHFIVTEDASNNMRFRMTQNFGQACVLRTNDETDGITLLGNGASHRRISACAGRGLVKQNSSVYEFQAACPFTKADYDRGDKTPTDMLLDFCRDLASFDHRNPAKPVPVLPEVVRPSVVSRELEGLEAVPVGVAKASLRTMRASFAADRPFVAGSNDWDLLAPFEAGVIEELAACSVPMLVLDPSAKLEAIALPSNVSWVTGMEECCETFRKTYLAGKQFNPEHPHVLIVNSYNAFIGSFDFDVKMDVSKFFESECPSAAVRLALFDLGSESQMNAFESWAQAISTRAAGVWIGDGVAEQRMIKLGRVTNDMYGAIPARFGYAINKGKGTLSKLLVHEQYVLEDDE